MPKKMAHWLLPVVLVLYGMSIGLSPDGKVPRMALAFGEHKDAAALVFILFGIVLFFLTGRATRPDGDE